MCQQPNCKYIEIKVDYLEKKKWYIHYRIEGKYFLKELYREEVEYIEDITDSDVDSDSDDGYPKKKTDVKIKVICKVPLTSVFTKLEK